MSEPIRVEPRPDYRIYVEFDDGVHGEVDLRLRLFGPMFEPLKDPQLFRQVGLDAYGAICWPNGADLAPDAIYDRLAGNEQA
jgi:hypothetical protein